MDLLIFIHIKITCVLVRNRLEVFQISAKLLLHTVFRNEFCFHCADSLADRDGVHSEHEIVTMSC